MSNEKPNFRDVPGMSIVGYAVRNKDKSMMLFRRYHDALNAACGTVSNHHRTGGEVFPVYAFEVSK